jgi:hypothetical protein
MIRLSAVKIDKLRSRLTGTVILPGDDAYDSARTIWNAAIDKRPGAIARCSTTSDVEGVMVGAAGLEPATHGLKGRCSTD